MGNKYFEVEKKFSLNKENINCLTQNAEFLGEKVFSDTYYDTKDYRLTTKDVWLRMRDGKYELKIPLNMGLGSNKRKLDQYQELTNDNEICNGINIPIGKLSDQYLEKNEIMPFATIVTTRKKYKKGKFIIDLDNVDFGFTIGEIELVVKDESETNQALNKIIEFAKENNIKLLPVRGKITEFIYRNNKKHYNALKKAGVL